MEEKYCQSCGMPMVSTKTEYGTNADGSKNEDYCKYCYEKGAFTAEITMEEMIEFCVPYMATAESGMSEDDARKFMQGVFPTFKRWKAA